MRAHIVCFEREARVAGREREGNYISCDYIRRNPLSRRAERPKLQNCEKDSLRKLLIGISIKLPYIQREREERRERKEGRKEYPPYYVDCETISHVPYGYLREKALIRHRIQIIRNSNRALAYVGSCERGSHTNCSF